VNPKIPGTEVTIRAAFAALTPRPIRRAVRRLLPNCVRYQGCLLPPTGLRIDMCGFPYDDNSYFLKSAVAEARRLVARLGCTRESQVVDIGSGVGRLAIGLMQEIGEVHYCGLEAHQPYVDWCRRYIERNHPSFRFLHVDVENERYNPKGVTLTKDFRLPVPDGSADIVYLWGLFTNFAPAAMKIYVAEISRIAKKGALVFVTAFVEEGVPPVSLNPVNYVNYPCVGPLHVVRYDRLFLLDVFAAHGLSVDEVVHHPAGADHMQSEIYLKKR